MRLAGSVPPSEPPSLKRIWDSGGVAIGAACKIPSSLAAEGVASAGVDYIYIDQQHGVIDNVVLLSMFQAIEGLGVIPVTRVPSNQGAAIGRALDFGAKGVIVPLIESRVDAERAVAACLYPPEGIRSHGSLRDSDEEPMGVCIALVESRAGVDNIGEIVSTTGIDAVMVGPQDLGMSIGLRPSAGWLSTPSLRTAIGEIGEACAEAKVVCGIGASSGQEAGHWIQQGFRMVNLGNDLSYMRSAIREHLSIARLGSGDPELDEG